MTVKNCHSYEDGKYSCDLMADLLDEYIKISKEQAEEIKRLKEERDELREDYKDRPL